MKNNSLIPNQVYPELGYVKGLMASGETASPVVADVMVLWKDYAVKGNRNISMRGDFEKQSAVPEASAEPEEAHDDLPAEDEDDSE